MNKVSLITVFSFFLFFTLNAKKIEGTILYEEESIDVVFDIPQTALINISKDLSNNLRFESLQYGINYYDKNDKKCKLMPGDAKEINFTYGNENIRILSVKNTLGLRATAFSAKKEFIFLKLESDGDVRLFTFYITQSSSTRSTTMESSILQKNNGDLFKVEGSSFKKTVNTFFSDCSSLAEKIEKKVFKKNDIKSIVEYYNSSCH